MLYPITRLLKSRISSVSPCLRGRFYRDSSTAQFGENAFVSAWQRTHLRDFSTTLEMTKFALHESGILMSLQIAGEFPMGGHIADGASAGRFPGGWRTCHLFRPCPFNTSAIST